MKTNFVFIIVIFFVASIFISYALVALTLQTSYSIPENEANYSNSTQGGDALGDVDNFAYVGVFIRPRPGATNVSLDTLIFVDQTRPVSVDLQINPETPMAQIKEEDVGHASRITIFYPAELLKPATTYNVSGSIMGLSAWWTFTTANSVIPQTEYDLFVSPYTWWIVVIAAIMTTTIFAKLIWHSTPHTKIK